MGKGSQKEEREEEKGFILGREKWKIQIARGKW